MKSYEFRDANQAIDYLESHPEEHLLAREMVIHIVAKSLYGAFEKVFAFMYPYLDIYKDDIELQNGMAFISWVTKNYDTCQKCSTRVISLNPYVEAGYMRLGLQFLGRHHYVDAFMALSAGSFHCQNNAGLKFWNRLVTMLMAGQDMVDFVIDEVDYKFHLSCFNTQAMESDAHHANGLLTELEELKFLGDYLDREISIVECGTLNGNHTVYFQNNLRPSRYLAFDADISSCKATSRNIELNRNANHPFDFCMKHAAVGDVEGRATILEQEVPVVSLSESVNGQVDFIKVDVDGMEMKVLQGARDLILRYRPKLMIEVDVANLEVFRNLMHEWQYGIIKTFKHQGYANMVLSSLV